MAEAGTVELDAQYRQLREECGLLDRSKRGKLLVEGSEAGEYLQGQLTNDVEGLEPGEGCYAALLDRKGHMQADMRVLDVSGTPTPGSGHGGDEPAAGGAHRGLWIDTEPVALSAAKRHLEMYKVGRDVQIRDLTSECAILSLIGPRSAELAGAPLAEHAFDEIEIAARRWIAVGTLLGIDLIGGVDYAADAGAALAAAGAPAVSEQAAEILRVEAGVPRLGAEMDAGTMPAEAGIVARAVDFEKGCYIGQETVARLHYRGKPNRHLRGLRLGAPAEPGAPLRLGEKAVGALGSSCVSPAHGPIGLAILRREAEPGAELAVGEDGVTARVVELPFG